MLLSCNRIIRAASSLAHFFVRVWSFHPSNEFAGLHNESQLHVDSEGHTLNYEK